MANVLWMTLFIGSFFLAVVVLVGGVGGCVAIAVLLSPWWLFLAVPVTIFLFSASINLASWLMLEF